MIKLAFLGVSDISIAPFSPYPGSELFRQLQNENKIPQFLDEEFYNLIPFSDMSGTTSWCEKINSRELNLARNIAMIVFYFVSYIFHPSRPFIRLYNLFKGKEETRMDKALQDMLRRLRLSKAGKPNLKPTSIRPFLG